MQQPNTLRNALREGQEDKQELEVIKLCKHNFPDSKLYNGL